MTTTATVNVYMDRKCAECSKGGAADSGICLKCTSKAMGHQPMRSKEGRAVRARFRASVEPKRKAMTAEVGDNSDKTLKRFAERIAGLMDQIRDIQDEVKTEMDAAKAAGFSTKALNKVVKEMGLDNEKRQAQLEFEWEVTTYRRIVGLPTELEAEKQEAA